MDSYKDLIIDSIKKLRKYKNLTQSEFAELCGMSEEGYKNIERKRYMPKASTIDKICKACNITPVDLILQNIIPASQSKQEKLISNAKLLDDAQLNIILGIIDLIKVNVKK